MIILEKVIARSGFRPFHLNVHRAVSALPVEIVVVTNHWNTEVFGKKNQSKRKRDIAGVRVGVDEV